MKKHNRMFWTCHTLIMLNFIFYLLCFFFTLYLCSPVKKIWKPWIPGTCYDIFAILIVAAIINTISNIIIVILPQRIIWNLQIPVKKKIGLSAITLVGVLWVENICWTSSSTAYADISACISSVLGVNSAIKLSHSEDNTYHTYLMTIYSYPEITFGILAVCLPILPKFVKSLRNLHLLSRLNGRSFHSIIHSKIDPRTFGAQSDISSAAKLDDGWNSLHAPLTNSKSLPDEMELATKKRNGESTEESHEIRHSHPLQILRTVHIATTHEIASASMMADLDNQASSMQYASRRH